MLLKYDDFNGKLQVVSVLELAESRVIILRVACLPGTYKDHPGVKQGKLFPLFYDETKSPQFLIPWLSVLALKTRARLLFDL